MSLPKTPIKGDAETRRFLEALRQQVADTANNALTVSDLRSNGFFANNGIDVGNGDGDDVAPPTTPTTLQASGAFENIILTWNFADYTGHSNSRIYRSLTNVFANAEVLANVDGRVYSDLVGGGKTYYYWVTNVNVNGIESATSQTGGVIGVTQANTQYVLNALTASITNTELSTALGTRISTVETNASNAASATTTITSRLNNFGGATGVSIETNASTTASNVTGLQGQYTVKIDNNGYVSGFGLASTPVNGTPFSDFIIRADRFSISSPSGPSPIAPVTPFIVTTTTSVIDGTTVPAGVYIKSATILDGAITNAKIKDLAVDDAKITSLNAEKITTGFLDAGRINIDNVTLDTYYDTGIARNRLVIKDLGVTTLKIGNNAVTVPVTAYTAASVSVPFNVRTAIQSCTITSSGGPILIIGSFSFDHNPVSSFNPPIISIFRDETEIRGTFMGTFIRNLPNISIVDQPAVGTYTYSIRVLQSTSGATVTASSISLALLETKR